MLASRCTTRPAVTGAAAVVPVAAHVTKLHHVQPAVQAAGPCGLQTAITSWHAAQMPCSRRHARVCAAAASTEESAPVPSTAEGKLISKTEVASFIQRDDLMDQMYRWAIIEAGEGGVRNFGMPMDVSPFYRTLGEDQVLWGYQVGVYKEGEKRCDLAIMFDQEEVPKHEWVGRGDDGFPLLEGKVDMVHGKHFEIWKLCTRTVDEELRKTIRAFCTQLVIALNRYYAFGSVFVDDAQ